MRFMPEYPATSTEATDLGYTVREYIRHHELKDVVAYTEKRLALQVTEDLPKFSPGYSTEEVVAAMWDWRVERIALELAHTAAETEMLNLHNTVTVRRHEGGKK